MLGYDGAEGWSDGQEGGQFCPGPGTPRSSERAR